MGARVMLAGLAALGVLGGSPADMSADARGRDGTVTRSAETGGTVTTPADVLDRNGEMATTPAQTGSAATTPAQTVGLDARPRAVWPVDGRVVEGFEPPASPYGAGHRGVKLDAAADESVAAAMAGRVSFAGDVAGTGWVTVAHGGGLVTTYGPVDAVVQPGTVVQAGETLGRLSAGATRLHWGARVDGEYLDPQSLFARWEVHLVAPPR